MSKTKCHVKFPCFLECKGNIQRNTKQPGHITAWRVHQFTGTEKDIVPQEPSTLIWETYDTCFSRQLGEANSRVPCTPGFSLEVFCWELLHLGSVGKLIRNSLLDLYVVWISGLLWASETNWAIFLASHSYAYILDYFIYFLWQLQGFVSHSEDFDLFQANFCMIGGVARFNLLQRVSSFPLHF